MKNPRWPSVSARQAFQPFQISRRQSSTGSTIESMKAIASGQAAGRDTVFQKSRSFATRTPGSLPAISAALIAPMEMPATQSGSMPAVASPSMTPAW